MADHAASPSEVGADPATAELGTGEEQTADLKIILAGDSAVGKSKLIERFLMDDFHPKQRSTYALTLYHYDAEVQGKKTTVAIWDTAGQERFSSVHPSYYYKAHACILCFDVTRKATYQHLSKWYNELRMYNESVPCIVVANKIDVDYRVTRKVFKWPKERNLPFEFTSAADGTNVVKIFEQAIEAAWTFKHTSDDYMKDVQELLADPTLGTRKELPTSGAGAAAAADDDDDDETA